MLFDLVKYDILEVVYKYSRFFAQNSDFIMTLMRQMRDENKYEGIITVAQLSKYKLLIETDIKQFKDLTSDPSEKKEELEMPFIDHLNFYFEDKDYSVHDDAGLQ